MSKQVLIIDDVHEMLTNGLTQLGYEVIYKPTATRSDLLQLISSATGLVVRTKTKIDAEVIQQSTQLQFIARAGAGLDNIDEQAAAKKGIHVFNAGEANADAVGEHTLGMMLSLFAKLNKSDQEVRQAIWNREDNRGEELSGKTVAIIGYGNTGKAVAKKLSGFDVTVLAYDKYLSNYTDKYATQATMDEVFAQADVLTLHVPLTAETTQLINANYLIKFAKPLYVLNMCRGEVVNTNHLADALEAGKVKGVALDVLENEKLKTMNEQEKKWFARIIGNYRTVLSPHVAGWTNESYYKISAVLLKKIQDLNLNESVS
jgi:D-3-phosphoglycerate dehydrogenase